MKDRSLDWLRQAEDDLGWAHDTYASERWSQCCFVCQQCGEKALKALALRRGAFAVKSHSITELAKELGFDGEIEKAARRLDQYYITARYPDALPAGAPFEQFDADQASEAMGFAETIFKGVKSQW